MTNQSLFYPGKPDLSEGSMSIPVHPLRAGRRNGYVSVAPKTVSLEAPQHARLIVDLQGTQRHFPASAGQVASPKSRFHLTRNQEGHIKRAGYNR